MKTFWNTMSLSHMHLVVTILCGAVHPVVHSTPSVTTDLTTSTMSTGDGTTVAALSPNNTNSTGEGGITTRLTTTLTSTQDSTNYTQNGGNNTTLSTTSSYESVTMGTTDVTSTKLVTMNTTSNTEYQTSKQEREFETTAKTTLSGTSASPIPSVGPTEAAIGSTRSTSDGSLASTDRQPTTSQTSRIVSTRAINPTTSVTTTLLPEALTTRTDDGNGDGSHGNAKVAAAVISALLIVFFLAVLLILRHRGKLRLYRRVSTSGGNPGHNATTFRDISQAASKRASRLYTSLFKDRTTRQPRPRIEIEIIRTSLRKAESPRSKIRGILSLHSSMPILSIPSDDDQQESDAKHTSLTDVAGASNDHHVCEISHEPEISPRSTKKPDVKAMTLPSQSTRRRSSSTHWDDRWSRRRLSQDMKRRSKKSKRPSSARHTWTLENRPATNDPVFVVDVKKIENKDTNEPIVVYVKRENRERDTVDIRLSVSHTTEALSVKPRQNHDLDGAGSPNRGSFLARRSFNPFSGGMLSFMKRGSFHIQEESGNAGPPKPKQGVSQ